MNMTRNIWLLLAALVATVCPRGEEAPLRVLILSGRNNHDWRQTTPKLKSILTASGRFAVEVTEHPEQCDAQTLSGYDALLSNWNTFGDSTAPDWPVVTRAALLDFVRSGKGFVVVHAGGSSFYDWPEYQQLVGASWNMGQTSHGSPHEFTVKLVDGHPITRGMQPFKTTDELWVRPGVSSLSRPLAYGDDQPIAFVLDFAAAAALRCCSVTAQRSWTLPVSNHCSCVELSGPLRATSLSRRIWRRTRPMRRASSGHWLSTGSEIAANRSWTSNGWWQRPHRTPPPGSCSRRNWSICSPAMLHLMAGKSRVGNCR